MNEFSKRRLLLLLLFIDKNFFFNRKFDYYLSIYLVSLIENWIKVKLYEIQIAAYHKLFTSTNILEKQKLILF